MSVAVSPLKYQPYIDGLRAVAVISVILFHLEIDGFGGGFVGVDVFFVISGFLITGLLKAELESTGAIDLGTFYKRRARRLLPALLTTLLLTAVISALLLSPSQLMRFGGALSHAVVGMSNHYFWLESDYFDVSSQLKPLLHTWSLSVEEQFYLFWPYMLLLCYRWGFRAFMPMLLVLLAIASFYLNYRFSDGNVDTASSYIPFLSDALANPKSTLFFLLPFRVFEFVIGGLLVWVWDSPKPKHVNGDLILWSGLLLIGCSVVLLEESMLFPYYLALPACIGTALIIYAGRISRSHWLLSNSGMVWIGKISYSLYLIHWPLIVFWSYQKETLTWLDQTLIVLLAVIASYISYRYIETPFRRSKIPSPSSSRWASVAMLGVLMCVVTGLHMKYSYGWPWRISSPLKFENVGTPVNFQRTFNGGAGYPSYGPVDTDLGSADLVLMGDSHGKHYAEGLYLELAKPAELSLYVAAGTSCFHLPEFTRTTVDQNWDEQCAEAMAAALSYIRSAESPPTVILSHAWNFQLKRADTLDLLGQRTHRTIEVDDVIAGILELKKSIGDANLIVIGNVPTTDGVNLYDILTRPRLRLFSSIDVSDYIQSAPIASLRIMNRRLKQAAQDSGQFIFADPFDVLCTSDSCVNIDPDKQLIYSDTTHLSKFGSRLVVRGLLPQWRSIINGPNNN